MPTAPPATDFNKGAAAPSAYAWLHWVNGALLLGLWAFTVVGYGRLPELVPGHIGPSGVTRWDAKQNSMWFVLPLIGTIHAVLMYGVSAIANGSPAGFNVPQKKRLLELPKEGQRHVLQPFRGFMYGMATWLLTLMAGMQYSTWRIARSGPGGEAGVGVMVAGVGLMLLVVLAMALWLNSSIRRRLAEWEQGHAAGH
jgi:uncharacterized membrane protein